jgi:uncharacterized protein YkwD
MRKPLLPLLVVIVLIGASMGSALASVPRQKQSGGEPSHARASRDGGRDAAIDERTPELRESPDEESRVVVTKRRIREIESLEQQCLSEINRLREAHGIEALEFDEDLLYLAREYSRRMAEEKFFSHADPDGRTVRDRVDDARIKWRMVGENLGYSNGYINPVAATVHGWMDSKGHRANILERGYRRTGIGAWIGSNGTVYFTEIFLR